jgi:hypothetical protein
VTSASNTRTFFCLRKRATLWGSVMTASRRMRPPQRAPVSTFGVAATDLVSGVLRRPPPRRAQAAARKHARRPQLQDLSVLDHPLKRPSTSEHGAEPDVWGRHDARRPERAEHGRVRGNKRLEIMCTGNRTEGALRCSEPLLLRSSGPCGRAD